MQGEGEGGGWLGLLVKTFTEYFSGSEILASIILGCKITRLGSTYRKLFLTQEGLSTFLAFFSLTKCRYSVWRDRSFLQVTFHRSLLYWYITRRLVCPRPALAF